MTNDHITQDELDEMLNTAIDNAAEDANTGRDEILRKLGKAFGLVHEDDLEGEATASKSYGERLALTGSNDPNDYPVGDDQLEAQAERADPDAIRETLGLDGRKRDENPDDYGTGEL